MHNLRVSRARGFTPSCAGSLKRILYSSELQSDGSIKLVKTGEQDIQELINSFYESTTLEVILAKYANGDLSALNRYQPIYADVSSGPKTLAESLQLFINGEHAFNALPTEIKKQFDNDYKQWILSSQSPDWFVKMKPVLSACQPVATSSVPDDAPASADS